MVSLAYYSTDGFVHDEDSCGDDETAMAVLPNPSDQFGRPCYRRACRSSMWSVFMLVLMIGLCNAVAIDTTDMRKASHPDYSVGNQTRPLRDTRDCIAANSHILHAMAPGDTVKLCGSHFRMEAPRNNNLIKRDDPCPPRTWTEAQIIGTGTWWSAWTKSSGCSDTCSGSDTCHQSLQRALSVDPDYGPGFDTTTSSMVLDLITDDSSLNLGHSWTDGTSLSSTWPCDTAPGAVSQVWSQVLMGWSDSQLRTVEHDCEDGTTYGDWGNNQHADYPMDASTPANVQSSCSSGSNTAC